MTKPWRVLSQPGGGIEVVPEPIECAACGRTRFTALLVDRMAHCCAGGWLTMIHHVQTYGGPEEGGWYYDRIAVEMSIPVTEWAPLTAALLFDAMYREVEDRNFDQPDYTSVLSTGEYEARFSLEAVEPTTTRPHYE